MPAPNFTLPWWSIPTIPVVAPYCIIKSKIDEVKNKNSETPSLKFVKDEDKTFDLCLRSVLHDGLQYQHVPVKLKTNRDIAEAVLNGNKFSAIHDFPWESRCVSSYKKILDINPRAFYYLSFHMPDARTGEKMDEVKEELFYYALSKDVTILNMTVDGTLHISRKHSLDEKLYNAILSHEGWRDKLNSRLVAEMDMYEMRRTLYEVVVE